MHYLSRRPALAPAATFVTLIFVLTFGLAAYGVYSAPGNWSNAWFAAVAALFVFPLVSTWMVMRRVLALYRKFATQRGLSEPPG